MRIHVVEMRLTPQPVKARAYTPAYIQARIHLFMHTHVVEMRLTPQPVKARSIHTCIHRSTRVSIGERVMYVFMHAYIHAYLYTYTNVHTQRMFTPTFTRVYTRIHMLTNAHTHTQVRSDFEVTCFAYEGIDSIKAALTAGMQVRHRPMHTCIEKCMCGKN